MFDADGVAEVACEQSPAVLKVECSPSQVKTTETKLITDVAKLYIVTYTLI